MPAIDWDSVPVAELPPGAVEVPRTGFGFLTVAGILELGVPHVLFRLPRENRLDPTADSTGKSISAYLADAGFTGPTDPLAHCWFIMPPPSMPTEGFWDALEEAEPLRIAGPDPLERRHGLREALGVLYSNS